MRDKSEVVDKFNDVRRKRLSEKKKECLNRCSQNCVFNVQMRVKGVSGKTGFCQNEDILNRQGKGKKLFVCDGEDHARRCSSYECAHTEESVEKDFDAIMRNPAKCGDVYPKLAMLIWFLQKDASVSGRFQRFKSSLSSFVRSFFGFIFMRWW